jgi:hypothetical protein
MREEAGHIVETPVEARAGFLDRPTLVVQYEPDDCSACRALYRFFCAVSRLS